MEENGEEMINDVGQEFKYYAFISYNQKDTKWGKRVQRKLEHYRMPATLCRERGWKRTPIRPIFFAPTDIQGGGLDKELQDRLRASRNLIVICSPNSAKSKWVGEEIKFFHSLGRTDNIHFFIVDGVPHSDNPDTECFNPVVDELGIPEILGLNIHEKVFKWPWLNKERAYVQLVSKLLGVEFDAIWKRHKRRLINRAICWVVGVVAVLAALVGVWRANQPFDTHLALNEVTVHNDQLPALHDAVITLTLDNESKSDTVQGINELAKFTNIPHSYMGKEAHVTFSCPDFLPVDTTLTLDRSVTLDIKRDPAVYGNVRFALWSGEAYIPNTKVKIAGRDVMADANGVVTVSVPLEEQQRFYKVQTPFPVENDTIYMPSGENDVLVRK